MAYRKLVKWLVFDPVIIKKRKEAVFIYMCNVLIRRAPAGQATRRLIAFRLQGTTYLISSMAVFVYQMHR